MKKLCSIILFLIFFPLLANHNGILQISIPKCGTHLLFSVIKQMTQISTYISPPRAIKLDMKQFLKINPQKVMIAAHANYTEENSSITRNLKNIAIFFLIRDLRDQIVSMAYHVKKHPKQWPLFINYSINEIISELISSGGNIYAHWPDLEGVQDFYSLYLPWSHEKNILTIKFEDLIGPQGGGNLETQLNLIINIAKQINIEITKENAKIIAVNSFGQPGTFRKGQIGSWKEAFTEKHKKVFKEVAGQLLIDLGYETDFDW